MRQPRVGAVGVQADGLPLAIKSPNCTESILRVLDNRAAFQAKRAATAVGLALTPFGGLQAVQLAPMQDGWHHVPQAPAGRLLRPTDGCCHRPRVNGMRVKGRLALAFCLLESVLLSELFGLPA